MARLPNTTCNISWAVSSASYTLPQMSPVTLLMLSSGLVCDIILRLQQKYSQQGGPKIVMVVGFPLLQHVQILAIIPKVCSQSPVVLIRCVVKDLGMLCPIFEILLASWASQMRIQSVDTQIRHRHPFFTPETRREVMYSRPKILSTSRYSER